MLDMVRSDIDQFLRLQKSLGIAHSDEGVVSLFVKHYPAIRVPFEGLLERLKEASEVIPILNQRLCPSELDFVSLVLGEVSGGFSEKWEIHKQCCQACQLRFDAYKFFVQNVCEAVDDYQSYCMASYLLAYLWEESKKTKEYTFERFFSAYQEGHRPAWKPKAFSGFLSVWRRVNDKKTQFWSGLVFQELFENQCNTFRLGKKPIFQVSHDSKSKQVSFVLLKGMCVKGGLGFYFKLHKKLAAIRRGNIIENMPGCTDDWSAEQPGWNAVFYGKVN